MEGSQFDAITKGFAPTRRRRLLQGLAGLLIAGLGRTMAGSGVDAKRHRRRATKQRRGVHAQSNPKSCDVGCAPLKAQAKTACRTACKACDGNFSRLCIAQGPFGPTAFTCCATNEFCAFPNSGVCCPNGTQPCPGPQGQVSCCAAGDFCNPATGVCNPPGVCDAVTGCFGAPCGVNCLCANSLEGPVACVTNPVGVPCGFQQCATNSECGPDGVCVDLECCPVPTSVCSPRCGG